MRASRLVVGVAALSALALAAIPAGFGGQRGDARLAALGRRDVVWSPSCGRPERGALGSPGGRPVDGVGEACELAAAGHVLYAVDFARDGRLVAVRDGRARILSPPGLALRPPVAPSPDGRAVAFCADLPPRRRTEPRTRVFVAEPGGRLVRLGPGCQPAWTPSGVVYISRFQRVFSERFGARLLVWRRGSRRRPLALPPGSMVTALTAVPGADAVAVVSVEPSVSQTLTVQPVLGGPAWVVRRIVGGQLSAAAPARGERFAFAATTRTGVTTLYLADSARRRVERLGRMPGGRPLWSQDGRVLVWASATAPWRVFDPATGRLVARGPARGSFAALP